MPTFADHPEVRWTHPLCLSCFQRVHPGRTPAIVDEIAQHLCCRCGNPTIAGIFVRLDPDELGACPRKETTE